MPRSWWLATLRTKRSGRWRRPAPTTLSSISRVARSTSARRPVAEADPSSTRLRHISPQRPTTVGGWFRGAGYEEIEFNNETVFFMRGYEYLVANRDIC